MQPNQLHRNYQQVDIIKMEKIYPSVEELSTIETSIRCTEVNCTAIFKSRSNLNLHLARHHKSQNSEKILTKGNTQRIYHCPSNVCIYHSEKCFKSMKYLKQHYIKVHSVKNHKCIKCHSGFATEHLKNLHIEYCGIHFKCPECPAEYACYDTLTTHARRKGHKIFAKIKYKALFHGDTTACSRIMCVVDAKPAKRLILPKDFLSINAEENKTIEDTRIKRKRRNKTEMQTQTHKIQAVTSSAGTQTELVSIHASTAVENIRMSKKSIKTQTTTVTSSTRACNTSFDVNLLETNDDVQRNSLGTQTLSPNILSQSITISNHRNITPIQIPTHVDQGIGTEDLLQSYINDCNADMETQTDWFTNLDLLTNDVHSNNYTQTCDDILPPDLRFNNTHTQTVLNDILRSVGSQTSMRVNGGVFTNNETQTDSIYEELLQEINS